MTPRRAGRALLALVAFCAACQPAPATPTVVPTPSGSPSPQTSVTVSPSKTPPLPTSTAGPAPRTFTDRFDGGLSYWTFVQVDNGLTAPDPQINSGLLRFDLTASNQWLYAIYSPQTYTDVRVDARITNGSTDGAAGIVCRYGPSAGWYELNVYPDQTYVLLYGQWVAPGVVRYTPIVRSQSEKIQAGQNDIGLQCQGNILTPFINGVQMRQRVENTYRLTTGKVGISAASFEDAPTAILYDWVKVGEP
jgi:hypothetical protein